MANRDSYRTLSPIRAATASHATQGPTPVHRFRSRARTAPKEVVHDNGGGAVLPAGDLSCPQCGAALLLQLHTRATEGRKAGDLPAAPKPETRPDFETSVNALKRDLLEQALQESGGVMTQAAKAIGLKYTTFVAMAHRLGVVESDGEQQADSDPAG